MTVHTWADGFGRWRARVTVDAATATVDDMTGAAVAAISAEVHERSDGSPDALAWRADVVPEEGPTFGEGAVSVVFREVLPGEDDGAPVVALYVGAEG